jgi:glycosyltransferase involved in cell wall biosynthesis
MIAPAPVRQIGDGKVRLDVKFAAGMAFQAAQWDGPVSCMLRVTDHDIPFGDDYDMADLPFDLQIVPADQPIRVDMLQAGDVIAASADMHDALHLADPAARPAGTRIIYAIEYDLETRLTVLRLQQHRNILRKLRSALWLYQQERRRKAAFRAADAIQANGYPAQQAYAHLAKDTLLYLDGRMSGDMMATLEQQAARAAHLQTGKPIRLVHSGRLEPMKGAQDLIPTVTALHKAGVDFTLDIFGVGSLSGDIKAGASAAGLQDQITLHGAVDFETMLVPFIAENADLFLSCHRQSDPSCTYLETMGCGVPTIGYNNRMWAALSEKSKAGWAVPLGQTAALARKIATFDQDRAPLIAASKDALAFARAHDFESEFNKRMAHFARFAGR